MIVAALWIFILCSALITFGLYFIRLIDLIQVRDAPYVPLDSNAIQALLNNLPDLRNKTVYELGSGDGRVALEVAHRLRPKRYLAIEKGRWPMLMAHLKRLRAGNPPGLEFVSNDIRNTNLSPANIVFVYLMDDFVSQLKDKFKKELKPGTILISCQFPLKGKRPFKTIEVENGPIIASQFYFYRY